MKDGCGRGETDINGRGYTVNPIEVKCRKNGVEESARRDKKQRSGNKMKGLFVLKKDKRFRGLLEVGLAEIL